MAELVKKPRLPQAVTQPALVLVILSLLAFAVEFAVMVLLFGELDWRVRLRNALLDSVLLVVVLYPVFWRFVYQPMRAHLEFLRESAARQRAILDSSLDAFISMDHEGKIVEFNPAAEEVFQCKRADVIGTEMAELILPREVREAHRRGLRRYLETGEPGLVGKRVEMTAVKRDGSRFDVELEVHRLPIAGPPVFSGFVRDISERRRNEEERSRLLGELHAALEKRDEFLSIASHELRTPLTALAMQIQIVRRLSDQGKLAQVPKDKLAALLRVSEGQISRFEALISDLLDVSRIDAGRLSLSREEVDLSDLVAEVVQRFAAEIEQKHCTVIQRLAAPLPGTWDRLRLEQVVSNLLSNALKYGAGKPVEITTSVERDRAKLVVRDGGIGISAEDQARIFERFERAASPKRFGGLGLGLYIVNRIVEAHGGSVHVESELGKGAKFIVELPR